MNWYVKAMKQYVDFSGRARRKEFWMFTLFYVIALVVATILDNVVGLTFEGLPYGVFFLIVGLAHLIPQFAIIWRRLHDTGRTGALGLLTLLPFVGTIIYIVFGVLEGNRGQNRFGGDPKAIEGAGHAAY